MNITDMLCYITVGQAAEDVGNYSELEHAFNNSFKDLADGFFDNVTRNIIEALNVGVENPLCVVLVSCVLVVLGFHLVPSIIRIFSGRR